MNPRNFFAELKRRNVYKVAIAYAIVGWLLIQVATSTFPVLEIPNWAIKLVIALVLLGFPIALILAWAFELTPEGIKRAEDVTPNESITHRTGRKLMVAVLVLLTVAVGLFVFRTTRSKPGAMQARSNAPTASATAEPKSLSVPEKSIAVLPFENLSDDKQNAYFTDGVQDEILTDLAKVADLKVISRTSVKRRAIAIFDRSGNNSASRMLSKEVCSALRIVFASTLSSSTRGRTPILGTDF